MSPNPPRLPRIERSRPAHVEDETAHLWAISYADFLMVLLSFFIIFFSLEKNHKKSAIDEIVAYTSKIMGGPNASVRRTPAAGNGAVAPLSHRLEGFRLEPGPDSRSLAIHLPDDVYKKGSAKLEGEAANQLEKLIQILKDFNGKVKVTFVGHTDQAPLVNRYYPGVNDNFDLSALRASSALRLAMSEGLDPRTLFLSGSAENKRNSRTLSILVEEEAVK